MQITDHDDLDDLVSSEEINQASEHMAKVCLAMGLDLDDASCINTPKRFVKYLKEFFNEHNYTEILGPKFESKDSAMVIQDQIPFRMICEHHLLPAIGHAAIGYVPSGFVVGLSKLSRLVDAVGTEQPSLQEHINERIANLLVSHIQPRGVIVVIEATHGCMNCRGVNRPGIVTRTSSVRGVLKDQQAARQEFLALAKVGRI